MSRRINVMVLILLPLSIHAQVLFPGNSAERRSRTYDVHHYKIVVAFDEAEKKVEGTTTITLSPLAASLDSLVLDAGEMDITSVSLSRGGPVRFANRSPQLVLFFDAPVGLADTMTFSVRYSCKPAAGLYFVQPDSSNPARRKQIWSQGEDTDNHFWFPCYDYPNDKATSEVIATVRESYVLLSNGKLIGTTHDAKNKTKTFHWFESKPHSSYLVMVAAGEYDVVREQSGSLPLEYYVYKDRRQDGVRSLAKTAAAMRFFEEKIGVPYPWEKYAQIWIANFMWGGMENVSSVTLNDDIYLLDSRAALDFTSDDVVAHELAHQWWGDLITSRDWNHLWLHEGFANYFEAMFKQHQKGDDYFEYDLMGQASGVVSTEDAHGRYPLVGKDGFTANVYSKGCWVLHMLRNLLGEQEFWKAIRYFTQRNAYRNVDSHEFMLALEDATGKNLGWFFEQWVYKAGHPKLLVNTLWNDSTKVLHLALTQTQVMDSLTGVFRFPLLVECTTSSGVVTTAAFVEQQKQDLAIALPGPPLMVILDKGKNLLATFERSITKEEYVYRLGNAGDIVDRIEAAKQLQPRNDDDTVFVALREAALHDTFWAVRNQAALSLASSVDARVKQTLVEISRDPHSSVRSTAIGELKRFHTGDIADLVSNVTATDSSYLVLAASIRVLADIDSARGFALAAKSVEMESYRNMIRRAALSALRLLKDTRAIPIGLRYSAIANPADIRAQSVRLLGELGKENPDARKRLLDLLNDGMGSIRKAAVESLGGWGDGESKDAIARRKLIEQDEAVKKSIDRALGVVPEESTGTSPGK